MPPISVDDSDAIAADRPSLRRRVGRVALPFAAYLLLAAVATYPLALEGGDHTYGQGAPELNTWAMGWVLHQLPRDPLHLFDGNVFHPYRNTLAFSEHLFVPALMAAPVVLLTGNLVLGHNVVALLTLALAGLGMYLLALKLVSNPWSAFAAGVLYAFHSWNVNELVRLQILSNEWFPFLLLALVSYFEAPSWRRGAAVGVCYALQSLSCMYWALYAPLLTFPAIVLLEARARHPLRRLGPLAAGLAPALLLSAVFFLPYLATAHALGSARPMPASLDLGRYLAVLPGNWLYHGLLPKGSPNANAAHFVGFAAIALALVGAARGRFRDGLPLGRGPFVAAIVVGFVLSLGPQLVVGGRVLAQAPYRWLYDWLPGFQNVRYPERFSILVILGLCPLVAAGLARLGARRAPLAVSASLILLLEHLSVPLPLKPLPAGAQIPQVYRWLATQDDIRVVAEVPAGHYWAPRAHAQQMYFSTVHWKRTLQGLTGYFPPAYQHAQWRLQRFPEAESIAFLEDLGVDAVVVRRGRRSACATGGPLRVAMSFDDGTCVVRLSPTGRYLQPPPPERELLVEVDRHGWRAVASRPNAAAALDGDPRTAWTATPWQKKGDAFRVRFAAPVAVARVRLSLPRPFEFPMRLRLIGERPDGESVNLSFDEPATYDRLFLSQLHTPRDASLTIDLPGVVLAGLALRIRETDPFQMPWTMSEIRVFTRPAEPAEAAAPPSRTAPSPS